MIVARFNCPDCETPIEALADSVPQGIKCPQCKTRFVPTEFAMTDEPSESDAKQSPDPIQNDAKAQERRQRQIQMDRDRDRRERENREAKWRQYNELRDTAGNCFIIGVILVVIGLVAVFVGFANEDHPIAPITVAGGAFSLGVILLFFSQFLHLRAALEKLSIKD